MLVFSSAGPADRAQVLLEAGRSADEVHQWIEKSLAAVATQVVQGGLSQRLIVAGGETSRPVVDALKIQAVEVLVAIDPGVPCLKSVGSQPLALALKSGNFGSLDFFDKAVTALRGISFSKEGRLWWISRSFGNCAKQAGTSTSAATLLRPQAICQFA